jgi:hypothetical protein
MAAGQPAGMVGLSFFDGLHKITKVLIVFLQFAFFHGKKLIIIAMDVIVY